MILLPLWKGAFARDIDRELPLTLLASRHSFKRVTPEDRVIRGAPAFAIASVGKGNELEFKFFDIFIALTIVADNSGCGCLTRVVLILFKEDFGTHWRRATATATTNFTIHGVG